MGKEGERTIGKTFGTLYLRMNTNIDSIELIFENLDLYVANLLMMSWNKYHGKGLITRFKRITGRIPEVFCFYNRSDEFKAIRFSDIGCIHFEPYKEGEEE